MEAARDIFDDFADEEADQFDEMEQEDTSIDNIKAELVKTLEQFDAKERKKEKRELSEELKAFIQAEVSKIKPKQNVIEKTIEKTVIKPEVIHLEPRVVEAPPQIIKEVRVEVQTEKKDKTRYVEESKYLDLLTRFSKLEKKLEETRRMAESPIIMGGPGGSGVIGIPPPEAAVVAQVLTVNSNKKAEWKTATGTGAGLSGYTVNNPSELKTFDVTDTSLDEVARILGSIITDLSA